MSAKLVELTENGQLRIIGKEGGEFLCVNQKWCKVGEVVGGLTEPAAINEAPAPEPNRCKCGAKVDQSHKCPFAEDVHNDHNFECWCCDKCRHECLMDI